MDRRIERSHLQIGVLEGKTNWDSWKKRLLLHLERFPGALELVQGRLVEPVLSPESVILNSDVKNRHEEDLKFYTDVNNYVLSALLFNMKPDIYQKVKDFKSGRQVWLELDRLFDTSQDEVYKLCNEFFEFKKQDNEDLIPHFVKLKNHWNKIQFKIKRDLMTHCVLPDFLLMGKLLDSLPQEYAEFKSTWLVLPKADKTFENFVSCLCAFERAQLHKSLKESRETRTASDMQHEDTEESDDEAIGSIPDIISQSRITLPTETVLEEEHDNNSWFVDVAATNHITFKKEFFTTFKSFAKGYHEIMTASGDTLDVEGIGTVQIEIPRKGCKTIMTLEDVLYVPSIRKNLFSVIVAQEALPDSLFVSKTQICILAAGNGLKITGLRMRSNGLFRLAFNIVRPVPSKEENISADELLQLYHERLGHQSKHHVADVVLRELGYKVSANREFCEGCYKGQDQRSSPNNNCTTRPGELIHADICGPFRESTTGFRYFVLFKDVFSEYRIVYFIKQKLEVIDYVKKLLAEFKKLNYSIGEFLYSSEEFNDESIREILSEQGIKQRYVMPHEQNGPVECEKLLDTARALMRLHSVLPQSLWDEIINTSSYILNLTAPTSVPGKSPIELWLKIKPNIEHLRVIGSTGYSNRSSQVNNNVENSIILGKLVGYSPFGSYTLWNEGDNRLIQTNDVIFTEEILISNSGDRIRTRNDEESTSGENKKCEDIPACNSNSKETSDGEVVDNQIRRGPSNQPGNNNAPSRNESVTEIIEDSNISIDPQANRIVEPQNYSEAVKSEMWREAMEKEINLLQESKTWELVELPLGHNAVPTQWVYKVITNPDGAVNACKAKIVTKGFLQKSQAFKQSFSPAAQLRALLSLTPSNLLLTQFDITSNTFNESIGEPLFVELPEGYNDGSGRVLKLKRSQHAFTLTPSKKKTFVKYLLSIGFFKHSSDAEDSLFKRIRRGKELFIKLQDDGLLIWRPTQHRKDLLDKLQMELKSIIQDSPDHSRFQLLVNRSEYIKTLLHRMMSGK